MIHGTAAVGSRHGMSKESKAARAAGDAHAAR
jgi:hypothetical protein